MTMHPVKSSNVKAIGYDATTKKLRVEFHGSGTYEFDNVTPTKHRRLMEAESIGKHFQAHIRHSHDFRKLEDE